MKTTSVNCTVLVAPNCQPDACDSSQDTSVVRIHRLHEGDDATVELAAACREAVGPGMTLMADVAYCWSDWKEALKVCRQLRKFDIFFVETPLPVDDLDGPAPFAEATAVRVAAGEWLQTRYEFADLTERGGVDVAQPDIGRVGGITEAMRVVQMASDRGKTIVPHGWKTGIGIAATAHVAAASPNCRFTEFPLANIEDGKIALPRRPGLGIELNEAAVERFASAAEDYRSRPAQALV